MRQTASDQEYPRWLRKDFSLFPKCTIIFFKAGAQGTTVVTSRGCTVMCWIHLCRSEPFQVYVPFNL